MAVQKTGLMLQINANAKGLVKELQRSKRRVSAFSRQMKQMGTVIASAFAVGAVVRFGQKFVSTISTFERGMAEVKAITGATTIEFAKLQQSALKLGESTEFTATQVSGLQKEYAKLGFTTQEILDASEATLNLALATGSELAPAATVVAGVLNSFNKNAKESKKLTDIMAKSFSSTALDLEKFSVGMANVGAAGNAMGFSISRVTALMGTLVDANIDGSKAGTDLRKIFATLAANGLTLEESLEKIRKSTNKVKTAQELFGQRAFVSALILADQEEKVKSLTEEFDNSAGSASIMSRIMGDTLQGALTRASSAWEGLILSMMGAKGLISGVVEGFTSLVRGITDLINGSNAISDALIKEQGELNALVGVITSANISQKLRNDLIDKLQKVYPKFLENLDAEKVTNKQLAERLKDVNDQFKVKIRALILEEKTGHLRKKFNKTFSDEFDLIEKINEAKERGTRGDKLNIKDFKIRIGFIETRREALQKEITTVTASLDAWLKLNDAIINTEDSFFDTGTTTQQTTGGGGGQQDTGRAASFTLQSKAADQLSISLNTLNARLKENQAALAAVSILDTERVDQLKKEGAEIKAEIASINESRIEPYTAADIIPNDVAQQAINNFDGIKTAMHDMRVEIIDTAAALTVGIQQTADAIGQLAVSAFEGTASVEDVLQGVLKSIANFVKQLGASMIATGVAALALESVLANPFAAIAAGAVLVALATATTALLNKGPKELALGGITTGPTNAIVGDNRSGVEAIIPLERFGEIFGKMGGSQVVVLDTILRGSDIHLSQQRFDKKLQDHT